MATSAVMANWAKGIDVSHHNGFVDFTKVKAAGHTFVGMKATEGNHEVDDRLVFNQKAVRAAGFDLAVYYHFARSGNPEHQAEHLIAHVGPLRSNERLCLDLEEALPTKPAEVIAWVEDFYKAIDAHYPGWVQLIYSSARVWRKFFDPDWKRAEDGKVALWAPRYNGQGAEPDLPSPWAKRGWQIWQWSDGRFPPAPVAGVTGFVDNDRWHGTVEELRSWVAAGVPPADVEQMQADAFAASLGSMRSRLLLGLVVTPERVKKLAAALTKQAGSDT